jgi:endonuclease/exonuclease/phosphatase family metal-dependent hydrolase
MKNLTKFSKTIFMKAVVFSISAILLFSCGQNQSGTREKAQESPVQFKVAAYNVEVSKSATPEEIGEAFKPYDLDCITFSEAPTGDWTKRAGAVLGMEHIVVGRYSTAGHVDKYKTIASKTPLYGYEEILMADTLHTVTRALTKINGKEIAIYSVHFPFGWRDQAHIDETTGKITAFVDYLKEKQADEISVVMGDFNFIPTRPDYNSMYYEMFVDIGLDVSWKELGIDVTKRNTHNAFDPEDEGNGSVIDHIMYSPSKVKALEGDIFEMEKPLSDHKPVWALLELK